MEDQRLEMKVDGDIVLRLRGYDVDTVPRRLLAWPVFPDHDKTYYLSVVEGFASDCGPWSRRVLSYGPGGASQAPPHADALVSGADYPFTHLTLWTPRATFTFNSEDGAVWTPDNGWLGIESTENVADLAYNLFIVTARRAPLWQNLFNGFYDPHWKEKARLDALIPSAQQIESGSAEQR